MYVIMDMEWVAEGEHVQITQIAALRIDSKYAEKGSFFSRVCPENTQGIDWFHIAYTAGSREQFLASPNWNQVNKQFCHWLEPDDVLIWWHVEPMEMFIKCFDSSDIGPLKLVNINKRIRKFIADNKPKTGNPYEVAKTRGIYLSGVEHDSQNDVKTVFQLLTCLKIAIKELVDPMVPSAVTTKMEQPQIKPLLGTMSTGKNKSKASKGQVLAIKHFNYVLDARKNLFHKQGCALINYQSKHLKGYDTLKGCLKEMAKPCGCCRLEYNECVTNGEQPERWWFYSKKSDRKIIHTAECCMYKRIGRENALYFTSLEQAHAEGYHLCSLCNPLLLLYKKEKKKLEAFCREAGLKIQLNEETIHVISRNDIWRIMLNQFTGKLMLYHRNNYGYKKKDPGDMSAFHRQEHQESTLLGYARYIANHDDYSDQKQFESQNKEKSPGYNPPFKRTKKGRKQTKAEKNKKRNKAISRTLSLIEELAAAEGR